MPSPTWPTIGAIEAGVVDVLLASRAMHSASREIGTHTSVVEALRAGPQRAARRSRRRGAPARAARVLGLVVGPLEAAAAVLGGDRLHRLGLLRDAGRASPWNSKNSVGATA